MTEIRLISRSSSPQRQLCVALVDDLAEPRFRVDESMKPFVALLALDAKRYTSDELGRFAEALLDQGCVYACAWGPGSERVHDLFDEISVTAELARKPYPSEVMTTWHSDESLDEALWFSTFVAFPPDAEVRAVIALSAPEWFRHIEARFADSESLKADVEGMEGE